MKQEIIIVGAGMGGLTAGIELAKAKKSVTILEKHIIPGGCATEFKRIDPKNNDEYVFEVALHQIAGLNNEGAVGKIMRKQGTFVNIKPIKQEKIYRTQKHKIVVHNWDQFFNSLKKLFPLEQHSLEELKIDLTRLYNAIDNTLFGDVIPGGYEKWTEITAKDLLEKYLSDKDLIELILSNYGYYHNDADKIQAFYYFIPEMEYIISGSYYPKGGSQSISNSLVRQFKELGGNILYKSKVTKIVYKGSKIIAVYVGDKKYEAKTFLFNMSHKEVYKLAKFNKEDKIIEMPAETSLEGAYIGIKGHFKSLSEEEFTIETKRGNYIVTNYNVKDPSNTRKNTTLMVTKMSNIKSWPSHRSEKYKEQKNLMIKQIVQGLEGVKPGIKDKIVIMEGYTPHTLEFWTGATNGAVYGYDKATSVSGSTITKFKNGFITGVWGDVGGGFEGAMRTGFMLGKRINEPKVRNLSGVQNPLATLPISFALLSFLMWSLWTNTVFSDQLIMDRTMIAMGIGFGFLALSWLSLRVMSKFRESLLPTRLEWLSLFLLLALFMITFVTKSDFKISADQGSWLVFGAALINAFTWLILAHFKPITCEYSKYTQSPSDTSMMSFMTTNKIISIAWFFTFILLALMANFIPGPLSSVGFSALGFAPLLVAALKKKKTIVVSYKNWK